MCIINKKQKKEKTHTKIKEEKSCFFIFLFFVSLQQK